jgi:DNA-binding IclR family transcriptional regulator
MSSLDKALQILNCYTADRVVFGVSEAAEELGMPKSSVSRLMKAMAEAGLLEQSHQRRGYSPGPLAFRLGNLYLKHDKVLDLAERALGRLVGEFGLTGYIGVLDRSDVVIVGVLQGSYPVRLVLPKGVRLPAYETAVGLTLLARLGDDEIRKMCSGVLALEHYNDNDNARLFDRIERVRADGYAMIEGVTYRGFNAIGVAVASGDDDHLISFSLSCPQEVETAELKARLRRRMVDEATEIGISVADPYWLARAHSAPQETGKQRLLSADTGSPGASRVAMVD